MVTPITAIALWESNMKTERFATLADMEARAIDVARECSNPIIVDVMIYSDNNGLSFRPGILLIDAETDEVLLRMHWDAFSKENNIDHMGKRARVEAREAGEWFASYIADSLESDLRRNADKHSGAAEEVNEIVPMTPVAPFAPSKLFLCKNQLIGCAVAIALAFPADALSSAPSEVQKRLAYLRRAYQLYISKRDNVAPKFGFVGVGCISFADARLEAFQRRAMRLMCNRAN